MLWFLNTIGDDNHSFQSYLKIGWCYVSRQLLQLKIVAFRTSKIMPTVRVDISVNYWSWHPKLSELPKFCQLYKLTFLLTVRVGNHSFQNYLKTGRCYAFLQLLELKTVAFRAAKILSLSELIFQWTTGVTAVAFRAT